MFDLHTIFQECNPSIKQDLPVLSVQAQPHNHLPNVTYFPENCGWESSYIPVTAVC